MLRLRSVMSSQGYKTTFLSFSIQQFKKMKMTEGIQVIQVEIEGSSELITTKFRQPSCDQTCWSEGTKTQNPSVIPSGEWRTNVLLEEDPVRGTERALSLRHLTSFEEKSMEDHGKILKNALENYLRSLSKRLCPEEEVGKSTKKQFTSWDETELALELIPNLDETKKSFLKNFSKRNVQAQLVLRQVLSNVPQLYLADCLAITEQIFKRFQLGNGALLEEEEIETFISLNYSDLAGKIKAQLAHSHMLPTDAQTDFEFEEMIGTWMKTIFLALIGVFQNPEDRKTPIEELEGFETFYTSRKLIKID